MYVWPRLPYYFTIGEPKACHFITICYAYMQKYAPLLLNCVTNTRKI